MLFKVDQKTSCLPYRRLAVIIFLSLVAVLVLPAARGRLGALTMSPYISPLTSYVGSTFLETSYSSSFEVQNPGACPVGQRCVEWCESWRIPGCPVESQGTGILCCVDESQVGQPMDGQTCRRPDGSS